MPHGGGAAQLRCDRNLQVDAQRVEGFAHRIDHQLVLVAVLGRLGQRLHRWPGRRPAAAVAAPNPRTARRPPGRPGAPPEARGSHRPARSRSMRRPPPSGRPDTRWLPGRRRRGGLRRCAHRAGRRRPTAAPGPTPPCAARCAGLAAVAARPRCGRGVRPAPAASPRCAPWAVGATATPEAPRGTSLPAAESTRPASTCQMATRP